MAAQPAAALGESDASQEASPAVVGAASAVTHIFRCVTLPLLHRAIGTDRTTTQIEYLILTFVTSGIAQRSPSAVRISFVSLFNMCRELDKTTFISTIHDWVHAKYSTEHESS